MTLREERLRAQLEEGLAVVVNLRTDEELIAWAKQRNRFARVDRRSPFGNPFILDRDGSRDEVCDRFKAEQLPLLEDRIEELRGKALGCWCSPERCHADALARAANATLFEVWDV
jgi:hypothetical protein